MTVTKTFLTLTLAFLALVIQPSPARAKDARDDLRAFLTRTQTVKTSFFQTTFDKNGKVTQTSEGILLIARPDRFRWETTKPFPQLIVGGASHVWFFDPDLNQVIVRSREEALGGTPAALLSGNVDVARAFTLSALPDQDGIAWVNAVPKESGANFSSVKIGFQNGRLALLEVTDAFLQKIVTKFMDVEENTALPDRQFTFTPPKDADVIR
ncbi:MAG: outer membrane lipoprotein chaperone LolA [Burkholderiales bacterium]|jgi:outer membrane lipoprotein carrier protein|nr:outer membrane lipoprotein chaperone LolA [Burkholderiales bacterium]